MKSLQPISFNFADLMEQKLEKWRRMKGRRSACCEASSVYNRSTSAVSLDMKENRSFKKRWALKVFGMNQSSWQMCIIRGGSSCINKTYKLIKRIWYSMRWQSFVLMSLTWPFWIKKWTHDFASRFKSKVWGLLLRTFRLGSVILIFNVPLGMLKDHRPMNKWR